jgi:membrane protein implicated in regulation of membrane protease activity
LKQPGGRAGDHGSQLVGLRRQVRRMLLVEVGVIVLIALVLGTVISLFTVVPTALASGVLLPSGPIWVYLVSIAVAFLIAWPVTMAASRLAMRKRPSTPSTCRSIDSFRTANRGAWPRVL